MSEEEIMTEVKQLSGNKPLTISLSGGNPATQDCSKLVKIGQEYGYRFAIETQGSIAQDWFKDLDILTLSPKPPSSGMKTNWDDFDLCIEKAGTKPDIALKIVVFDDADYTYAKKASNKYPDLPIYLQPGNHQIDGNADIQGLNERLKWLADKVTKDQWYEACVLPQLHVLIWGNERGV